MKSITSLVFLALSSLAYPKVLFVEDIKGFPDISVSINGDYYENKTEIPLGEYSPPLNVNVYYVDKAKPSIVLAMKKTFPHIEEENHISNRETIIGALRDMVGGYISIPSEEEIRGLLVGQFEGEIAKYTEGGALGMNKRMGRLDLKNVDRKILEIVKEINSQSFLSTRSVSVEGEMEASTLEVYELNDMVNEKLLNFIGTYKVKKKKADIQARYNTNVLVFVHSTTDKEPEAIYYLGPYERAISKEDETWGLINFEFDRMMNECTHEYNFQRKCYFFDKVEGFVNSKEELLSLVLDNLPADFEKKAPTEKMREIKDIFEYTVVETVTNQRP